MDVALVLYALAKLNIFQNAFYRVVNDSLLRSNFQAWGLF